MAKNHEDQFVLKHALERAQSKVTVGAKYYHYKGKDKTYKVIGLGFLEATEELCVIYQAQYGEGLIFIRPLRVWLETVEWQGTTVPRFTKI